MLKKQVSMGLNSTEQMGILLINSWKMVLTKELMNMVEALLTEFVSALKFLMHLLVSMVLTK